LDFAYYHSIGAHEQVIFGAICKRTDRFMHNFAIKVVTSCQSIGGQSGNQGHWPIRHRSGPSAG
jgi:hypothetical protein